MKKLIFLLFLSGLAGCAELYKAAYPYDYQKQQEQKALDAANFEKLKCEQRYAQDQAFDPIRQLMPYKPDEATFAQLSNSSKPTKKEKIAIEALDEMSQSCFKNYMTYYKEFNANWRSSLAEAYQQNQRELLLRLWEGKLTYGQYGEQRIKLLQLRNKIQDEEFQKHRQGMADDLLMMQAMGVFSAPKAVPSTAPVQQPQRPFNAPGTAVNPIQTNCNSMGATVNCQTYSY